MKEDFELWEFPKEDSHTHVRISAGPSGGKSINQDWWSVPSVMN